MVVEDISSHHNWLLLKAFGPLQKPEAFINLFIIAKGICFIPLGCNFFGVLALTGKHEYKMWVMQSQFAGAFICGSSS